MSDREDRASSVNRCLCAATMLLALVQAPSARAAPPEAAPGFQVIPTPRNTWTQTAEPSIGFNPKTGRGMFQDGVHALRYVLPEYRHDDPLNPDGLPEACDTIWQDVSPDQATTLDPIGLMDPETGRYFANQLALKGAIMHYTDNDGASWTPTTGNFPAGSGTDHQTVGWAPYVPDPVVRPLTAYPHAIYYCAQDSDNVEWIRGAPQATGSTAGYANCARSDDGGQSFGAPVTIYTTIDCDGLHGHLRAGPDGTLYVPNKNCKPEQGVAVSENNGLNWAIRRIPGTSAGKTDPQISLASDGTGYFCYTNGDGHARAAVTHDHGKTWSNDADLGAQVGVVTAVFTQGTAGDPDRAACGFLGTTTPGNSEAVDFAGVWYPYISVTYDGGKTWRTTNVSPGDPAQGVGGICTAAQACGVNRNLLDFNDMTLDDRGRPLYGFADGCTGTCDASSTSPHTSDEVRNTIARMAGGKSLYAKLDQPEPHAPQAACLSGFRGDSFSRLEWRSPAHDGGASIGGYRIYRSTTAGAAGTLLASTGAVNEYVDTTADPRVPEYYYTVVALNSAGAGVRSNRVLLPVGGGTAQGSSCVAPGVTILDDPEGDEGDTMASHDVRRLSISQPAPGTGEYTLHFHLKVASLADMPAGTAWRINFCSPAFACTESDVFTTPYGADNQFYTLEMSTAPPASAAAPAFTIYQPVAGNTNAAGRRAIAALGSSRYTVDGLITIGANASDLGLSPGGAGTDALRHFQAQVAVSTLGVSSIEDSAPDSGSAGEFVTRALDACVVTAPPVITPDPDAVPDPGVAGDPVPKANGNNYLFGPSGGTMPTGFLVVSLGLLALRRRRR